MLNHNTNLKHLKGLNETKYGSILNADRVYSIDDRGMKLNINKKGNLENS